MKSFDEILQDGKDNASETLSSSGSWKDHVNTIMESLHKLNEMYGNDEIHNVKVELKNCKKCNRASFVLAVRDINNVKRVIRFYKAKWSPIEKGTYFCETCKKVR